MMLTADPAALQAGRLAMRRKCIEVALANTPSNVTCIRLRKSLSGSAIVSGSNYELMMAPKPVTRKSLYIFLHECAHFALHVKSSKPRHVEELEAEMWAHQRMREAGIPVPRSMTKRAKRYVRFKIHQATMRGAKRIDPAARRFAKW